MNFQEFSQSLGAAGPEPGLSPSLQALWHAKNGYWEKAHHIVQDLTSSDAALVHAWLHRQEGDESNALYWYRRAGARSSESSLVAEWEEIAQKLLNPEAK